MLRKIHLNFKEKNMLMKIIVTVFAVCIMSISSAFASFYDCRTKVQTGCGYSESLCSGKYLKCIGYYDSSSEKYFVMNHIDGPNKDLSGSDGCYAGKRNASISIFTTGYTSYSGCAHTHSYTKNLI